MIDHKCVKCMWHDRTHVSLKDVPDNYGYCRKHKPVIYLKDGRYYGGWPLTDIHDFCGEFRLDVV